jgi:hypothetical protein
MINACLQRQMTDIAQEAMEDPDSVPPSAEDATEESDIVPPGADNNVMKITENCLFIRTAYAQIMGGRYSTSWWMMIGGVFIGAFSHWLGYEIYGDQIESGKFQGSFLEFYFSTEGNISFLVPLGFFLIGLCLSIPWRTQLPIIFNRKTQRVTTYIKGLIFSVSWENMKATVGTATSAVYGGVPVREGILRLYFPYQKGKRKKRNYEIIGVYSTTETETARRNVPMYGAGQIWAYICVFMNEGAAALPPFEEGVNKYRLDHISESFKFFNPMKMFPKDKLLYPITLPFFIFFIVPCSILIIIGDLLYMALDRILPKRKWSQELLDACDNVWDGSGD